MFRPSFERLEPRNAPSPLTAADVILGPNTAFLGTTREAVVATLTRPVDMELSALDRSMIGPATVVMVYPQREPLPPCVLVQWPLPGSAPQPTLDAAFDLAASLVLGANANKG